MNRSWLFRRKYSEEIVEVNVYILLSTHVVIDVVIVQSKSEHPKV